MTLRLSSGSSLSSSTTATSIDTYLQKITDDTSISQAQKNDCLKTLGIVLKNLIDPAKGGASGDAGLKYRTLKLDNPKIRARLFCSSSQIEGCVRDLLTDASLVGMSETPTAEGNRVTLQLEQRLSEKQKARRLREEKERLEKEQDKLHRQKTRAQIRADKHVRLHDENWKPTVSAAADKSGTGLQTFRDRHGE
eukprot:jgi/Psemu1/289663/fgenesh1_pg.386_\